MKFCHILKLPDTKITTIISLNMAKFQHIWRNKDFTYIYLTETQTKWVNIKVTKIVFALWETFAQSASRVRGCLFVWGFAVLFPFLLFLVTIPFSQRCFMPHVWYSPPGRLLKTAPCYLRRLLLIRHKSPSVYAVHLI